MPSPSAVLVPAPLAESIRDLADRCLTYAELRHRPAMPTVDDYELPAVARLVYGVIRKAVAAGGAGARVSYPELAKLTHASRRACIDAVRALVERGLVRRIHTSRPSDKRLLRGRNLYVLGENARPVRVRPGSADRGAAGGAKNALVRPEAVSPQRGKPLASSVRRRCGKLQVLDGGKEPAASAAGQNFRGPAGPAHSESFEGASSDPPPVDERAAWSRAIASRIAQEPGAGLARWAEAPAIRAALERAIVADGVAQPARADGSPHTNPAAVGQGLPPGGRQ